MSLPPNFLEELRLRTPLAPALMSVAGFEVAIVEFSRLREPRELARWSFVIWRSSVGNRIARLSLLPTARSSLRPSRAGRTAHLT